MAAFNDQSAAASEEVDGGKRSFYRSTLWQVSRGSRVEGLVLGPQVVDVVLLLSAAPSMPARRRRDFTFLARRRR